MTGRWSIINVEFLKKKHKNQHHNFIVSQIFFENIDNWKVTNILEISMKISSLLVALISASSIMGVKGRDGGTRNLQKDKASVSKHSILFGWR